MMPDKFNEDAAVLLFIVFLIMLAFLAAGMGWIK